MNKIIRLGSLFFTVVLLLYAMLKYSAGNGKSAIFYILAAVGFLLICVSYWKRENKK